MLGTTETPLDRTEIWLCRIASLLALVSFGAFVLNSSAIPAFADHVLRLASKFVF